MKIQQLSFHEGIRVNKTLDDLDYDTISCGNMAVLYLLETSVLRDKIEHQWQGARHTGRQ